MRTKDTVITIGDFLDYDECEVVRQQAANDDGRVCHDDDSWDALCAGIEIPGIHDDTGAESASREESSGEEAQTVAPPELHPSDREMVENRPGGWLPRQQDLEALVALHPLVGCSRTNDGHTRWPLFVFLEPGRSTSRA